MDTNNLFFMKTYIIIMLSLAILHHSLKMIKRIEKRRDTALFNLIYIAAYILALIFTCSLY
jgi:hypothetical protein